MLKEVEIQNFKSIIQDKISLGRINVLIGENGCGKSNILEALMFASVIETYDTIDSELLYLNGIRVGKPSLMVNSFLGKTQKDTIQINLTFDEIKSEVKVVADDKNNIFTKWKRKYDINLHNLSSYNYKNKEDIELNNLFLKLQKVISDNKNSENTLKISLDDELKTKILFELNEIVGNFNIQKKESREFQEFKNFIIYTLNTEALRGIPEFQISRKGRFGETIETILSELNNEETKELKRYLYTIDWINTYFIDSNNELIGKGYKLDQSKSKLYFSDKYMMMKNNVFSSENANEGILHVIFYLGVIISSKTSTMIAIDNIETALNPHLCQHLMSIICELAKKFNKQLFITTHNPAILDGLNLHDDDIRLFEVKRIDNGSTKTRRIKLKPTIPDKNLKLSELWTRGYLGGISQNF